MPAYMVFIREGKVFNQDEMDVYTAMNRAHAADFKLTPLVIYGDLETMEGDPPDGVVVVQFPTMDDARAWYYSPEYQAALEHRKLAANYRAFLVEGI